MQLFTSRRFNNLSSLYRERCWCAAFVMIQSQSPVSRSEVNTFMIWVHLLLCSHSSPKKEKRLQRRETTCCTEPHALLPLFLIKYSLWSYDVDVTLNTYIFSNDYYFSYSEHVQWNSRIPVIAQSEVPGLHRTSIHNAVCIFNPKTNHPIINN